MFFFILSFFIYFIFAGCNLTKRPGITLHKTKEHVNIVSGHDDMRVHDATNGSEGLTTLLLSHFTPFKWDAVKSCLSAIQNISILNVTV